MRPVLFHVPGIDLPIFGYGLMMMLGVLAAMELAKFLARRSRIDPEIFGTAALIALFAGIVGARLSHVLENLHQYTDPSRSAWANLQDALNIRSGGLTFYGGLLFATPIVIYYAIRKRVPLRLGMDIVAPCLMLGLAFGRVGCFLNGCCYGATCELPWAVRFPYYSNAYVDQFADRRLDAPEALRHVDPAGHVRLLRPDEVAKDPQLAAIAQGEHSLFIHPAQLYSAFNALLIAATLVAFFTIPHAPGRVFALMLILKGITRFLLELLRTEPAVLGPMSLSMVISVVLVIVGAALWVVWGRGWRPPEVATPTIASESAGVS